MSHNTTRPGLTRPLTTLGVALITASIATTALAGVALAGKAPPTPFFGEKVECIPAGTDVNPMVNIGFEGKGRWTRALIRAEAVDKDGKVHKGSAYFTDRLDMRSLTPVQGVPVDADLRPLDVKFYAVAADRNGAAQEEEWTPSGSYTCS